MSGEQVAARALALIDQQVGADQVACVVIEPIQGEGGFIVPAPGFLPGRADCERDHSVKFGQRVLTQGAVHQRQRSV